MEIGSIAEWVAALFTGAGLLGAVIQLRASLKDSRFARDEAHAEEANRQEAMARAVGVKIDWQPGPDGRPPQESPGVIPARVEILNSAPYPISGVVLVLATDTEELPRQVVYGTILPGEHIKEIHKARRREVVFGELMGGAWLQFTDAYGNHWERSPHDLRRLEYPARIC